jgi:hypothetical protein
MPIPVDLWRGPEGTIYEKGKGFNDNLRIEVDPTIMEAPALRTTEFAT